MKLANTLSASLRQDNGFLIGRTLAFIAVAFISQTAIPLPLIVLAFAVIATSLASISTKLKGLLPYAFLGAAALWGGVAATLLVDGTDGIGVMLGLILAVMDGSSFVAFRCTERE